MVYLPLKQRVQGRPFPDIHIVDMRHELDAGNRSMFSRKLTEALTACVERGEQAVLFSKQARVLDFRSLPPVRRQR